MAVKFITDNPRILLSTFKKAIEEGKVATWSFDQDGDFTHSAVQWKNLAWLRPKINSNELVFIMIPPKNKTISSLVYAVYHGRLIESMLNHCDTLFDSASATAYPSEGDRVS